MFKNSTLRTVIDPLFEEAGFVPRILFETSSNLTLCNMAEKQHGLLADHSELCQGAAGCGLLLPPSHPFWELCATYKKGHYLTKAGKTFIELAIEYYHSTAKENNQSVV